MNLLLLIGQVALAAWSIVAWLAFRRLNGLSRWRSLAALALAALFAVPIIAVLVLVQNAIGWASRE